MRKTRLLARASLHNSRDGSQKKTPMTDPTSTTNCLKKEGGPIGTVRWPALCLTGPVSTSLVPFTVHTANLSPSSRWVAMSSSCTRAVRYGDSAFVSASLLSSNWSPKLCSAKHALEHTRGVSLSASSRASTSGVSTSAGMEGPANAAFDTHTNNKKVSLFSWQYTCTCVWCVFVPSIFSSASLHAFGVHI